MAKSQRRIPVTVKVYGIFNSLNDWVYIGSTRNGLRKRWREQMCLLRMGRHTSTEMLKDFEACGKAEENFIIRVLEELPAGCTVVDKRVSELFWMQKYQGRLYNAYQIAYEPLPTASAKGREVANRTAVQRMVDQHKDPELKARRISGLTSSENRASRAARMKELWKDPVFRAARLKDLEQGRNR